MKAIAPVLALHRRIVSFAQDRRGVSAVEFAMLLPLMVTLYLGTVEITQGVAIDRKVTLTTRTVADLASQVSSINNADMTNILSASAAVMAAPSFNASSLRVVVSAVKIDSNGAATVCWSDTLNGTAHPVGNTVTLPAALVVNNTTLIWSEVTYAYTPAIGYVVTGTLNLGDQIYMRPRLSATVARVPNYPCT
jgi:Flp pilus assembly protein TadG